MRIPELTPGIVDWSDVERTEHPGDRGSAFQRSREFGEIRVRIVEYSAGYLSDRWCARGHINHCPEGEVVIELEDDSFVLQAGMSRQLPDDTRPHRASSSSGATLFIVD